MSTQTLDVNDLDTRLKCIVKRTKSSGKEVGDVSEITIRRLAEEFNTEEKDVVSRLSQIWNS